MRDPRDIEEIALPPPSLADVEEVPDPSERDERGGNDAAPELLDDGEEWPGEVPDELKEHR